MTKDDTSQDSRSIGPDQLTDCLSQADAYAGALKEVGFLQTHISLIFFADQRVYKVKKPVDFGFLDFTSLEQRKFFCEEEVRLNRRLAPEIYLGVVPITRTPDGKLHMKGEGEIVEWAVEMVRLPEHRMFSNLLARGEIDNEMMNTMASVLADFHASCPTGQDVDPHGEPSAIEGNHNENFEQLQGFVGFTEAAAGTALCVITRTQHQYLQEHARAFFLDQSGLLERRVHEHRIREGHGDLHAGNLCFAEGGMVAYDCIEFSRRFRCGDVASELAFLAMDLDFRGYPSFGAYLVKRYAEACGDLELETLEPFYKCYRAVVRGKVTAMTASDPAMGATRREELRLESMGYLQLALGYHLRPVMILMCGLPASGKSWLAKRLVRPLRASLLRSDVRRKRLDNVSQEAPSADGYGAGRYSLERKAGTYHSLLESALGLLQEDRSVILDATFSKREYRELFADAAQRHGFDCLLVQVTAEERIVRERMEARKQDPHSVSDAGIEVYLKERELFEEPDELPAGQVVKLASGAAPAEVCCSKVLDQLISNQRS